MYFDYKLLTNILDISNPWIVIVLTKFVGYFIVCTNIFIYFLSINSNKNSVRCSFDQDFWSCVEEKKHKAVFGLYWIKQREIDCSNN